MRMAPGSATATSRPASIPIGHRKPASIGAVDRPRQTLTPSAADALGILRRSSRSCRYCRCASGAQTPGRTRRSVAEQFHQRSQTSCREHTSAPATEVVLGRIVDDLTLRRDDEQGVKKTCRLPRPASLAMRHDYMCSSAGERGQSRSVSGPGMSTNRSRAAVFLTCGMSKISSVNRSGSPASAISARAC